MSAKQIAADMAESKSWVSRTGSPKVTAEAIQAGLEAAEPHKGSVIGMFDESGLYNSLIDMFFSPLHPDEKIVTLEQANAALDREIAKLEAEKLESQAEGKENGSKSRAEQVEDLMTECHLKGFQAFRSAMNEAMKQTPGMPDFA